MIVADSAKQNSSGNPLRRTRVHGTLLGQGGALPGQGGNVKRLRGTVLATITLATLFAGALALAASELAPRESVAGFPHSCEVEDGEIGVEYLGRYLPTPRGMKRIPRILVVEIALYPKPGRVMKAGIGQFQLDWKRADRPVLPVGPEMVGILARQGPWDDDTYGQPSGISIGSVDRRTGRLDGVIIGGRPRRPRFPDDPRQDRTDPGVETGPAPNAPKYEPHPDELPERIIELHALSNGRFDKPAAGYLFFPYGGKLKKLKGLKLLVQVSGGGCEVKLRK